MLGCITIIVGADGTGVVDALLYVPMLLVGIAGLSAAHVGHAFRRMNVVERLALAAAAAAILMPGTLVNLGGTLVILLIAVNAYRGGKNVKAA